MSELEKLNQEIIKCTKCSLSQGRTNVVPGEGNPTAEIMFIGEGPGFHEDKLGRPFVGAAGKFLDQLLASINLKRADVYIANVIKCRPPENRDPMPEELKACWPWLEKQIELIKPKLIITLGRHAMGRFLPPTMTISQVHGQPKRFKGQVYLPMYHPAAGLYNGGTRPTIEADFKKIPKVLAKMQELKSTEAVVEEVKTQQKLV